MPAVNAWCTSLICCRPCSASSSATWSVLLMYHRMLGRISSWDRFAGRAWSDARGCLAMMPRQMSIYPCQPCAQAIIRSGVVCLREPFPSGKSPSIDRCRLIENVFSPISFTGADDLGSAGGMLIAYVWPHTGRCPVSGHDSSGVQPACTFVPCYVQASSCRS